MGYAVCHRDTTGALQVDDVASLDAAVETVERLRNEDGTSDVRVFREVPIEVRTYYKVIITDEDVVPAPPGGATPEPPVTTVEVVEAPEPVVVATATAAGPGAPIEPLPGAFPLASPAPPVVEVHDAEHDTAGDASRRHSLFSRGG
jgi:hypothetical protein